MLRKLTKKVFSLGYRHKYCRSYRPEKVKLDYQNLQALVPVAVL